MYPKCIILTWVGGGGGGQGRGGQRGQGEGAGSESSLITWVGSIYFLKLTELTPVLQPREFTKLLNNLSSILISPSS